MARLLITSAGCSISSDEQKLSYASSILSGRYSFPLLNFVLEIPLCTITSHSKDDYICSFTKQFSFKDSNRFYNSLSASNETKVILLSEYFVGIIQINVKS